MVDPAFIGVWSKRTTKPPEVRSPVVIPAVEWLPPTAGWPPTQPPAPDGKAKDRGTNAAISKLVMAQICWNIGFIISF